MADGRSQRHSVKSLLCLIQGLQNYRTTIELRNEIVIDGRIEHVDDRMNTSVSTATYRLLDGSTIQFDQLFIQGAQIRYVHIPDGINVMSIINKKVDEVKGTGRKPLYSRQVVSAIKKKRYDEERKLVREFVMGKGRAKDLPRRH